MATVALTSSRLTSDIVDHLLVRLTQTPTCDEPYSHFYVENVFPAEVYADMMANMPAPGLYKPLSLTKHRNAEGVSTRDVFALTGPEIESLPPRAQELWMSVAAALSAPELKVAVFRKLSTDLVRRFGCRRDDVDRIISFTKPSLFRDLEGYEIPPHPDGRTKVVTMQLYLPVDYSQLHLGTAVYKRRFTSLKGIYTWHGRFEKVKQFLFQPNSGYAFAVSNSLGKKSWHGREEIPGGSGVRNSLLNLFFATPDRSY
ncbi:MAG TPA: hypothetical protein VGG30_08715 [Pirellulales bacterium]|jgi:hypothetical protein